MKYVENVDHLLVGHLLVVEGCLTGGQDAEEGGEGGGGAGGQGDPWQAGHGDKLHTEQKRIDPQKYHYWTCKRVKRPLT